MKVLYVLVLLEACYFAQGMILSAPPVNVPPKSPEQVVILKSGSLPVQSLPASYVCSLPHFAVVNDKLNGQHIDPIPSVIDGEGWVNPHSMSELWVPMKMASAPRAALALGALVKDGQLRCVFPAVDSFVAQSPSKVVDDQPGLTWRNWGLSSVPLASTWLDHDYIPLTELKMSAFNLPSGVDGTPEAWHSTRESVDVSAAINTLVEFIADPPVHFPTRGFALLSVPIAGADIPLPQRSSMTRVYLSDYPKPRKLVELRGEASGAGFLEFTTLSVASGADSPYLPGVYKPLFTDPNPALPSDGRPRDEV